MPLRFIRFIPITKFIKTITPKVLNEKINMFVPKVIWSNGTPTPIIDLKGEYGLTQFAYAIVDSVNNLNEILSVLNNPKFIELMEYVKLNQNNKYNYKVIGLFKKDFWKVFLDYKDEDEIIKKELLSMDTDKLIDCMEKSEIIIRSEKKRTTKKHSKIILVK